MLRNINDMLSLPIASRLRFWALSDPWFFLSAKPILLEAKKTAFEKEERKLKTDSELLLIKAADDAEKAYTYAIEEKMNMEEHKKKRKEINKLEDTTKSVQEQCKAL